LDDHQEVGELEKGEGDTKNGEDSEDICDPTNKEVFQFSSLPIRFYFNELDVFGVGEVDILITPLTESPRNDESDYHKGRESYIL